MEGDGNSALETTGQADDLKVTDDQTPPDTGQGDGSADAEPTGTETPPSDDGQTGTLDKEDTPPVPETPFWEKMGFKSADALGDSYKALQRKLSSMGEEGSRLKNELRLYQEFLANGEQSGADLDEIQESIKRGREQIAKDDESRRMFNQQAELALERFKIDNKESGLEETDYAYVCALSAGCSSMDFGERLKFGMNRFNEIESKVRAKVEREFAKKTQKEMKDKSTVPGGPSSKAETKQTNAWSMSEEDFQKKLDSVRNRR